MYTLFELRKQLEMHRQEDVPVALVASRIGMSPNTYRRVERGTSLLNILQAKALAQFYAISLDELMAVIQETMARDDAEDGIYPVYGRRKAKPTSNTDAQG